MHEELRKLKFSHFFFIVGLFQKKKNGCIYIKKRCYGILANFILFYVCFNLGLGFMVLIIAKMGRDTSCEHQKQKSNKLLLIGEAHDCKIILILEQLKYRGKADIIL